VCSDAREQSEIEIEILTERFKSREIEYSGGLEWKNTRNNLVAGRLTVIVKSSLTVIDNSIRMKEWQKVITSLISAD
jgi:hypothetical protein